MRRAGTIALMRRPMEAEWQPTAGFRTDINGLRAWAVVAVMLYHFGVPGFAGGFIGVDVFLVISGFLMTGIVVRGLESGRFSISAFFMARARRILPALIVLCAVLMALGWWVLLPTDYLELGTDSVFSLAFLSNIRFWLEAGYFDAPSREKWLLHTWSVAVEWQFYLLLPLSLLAVWSWRPGRRPVVVAMLAGLLISLGLCIVLTVVWPAAAFYLLPTRAWEMLAGGLVFLLADRVTLTARQRIALEAGGLALVVGAVAGLDSGSPWPGWRAIVPVAGTVGVLLSGRPRSIWTSHPVAQWLGTRSYSLYLWHWPIVVALTYVQWQTNPAAIAAGLVLTLVLADFSYQLVESPARLRLRGLRLGSGLAALLGGVAAVAAPAIGTRLSDGVVGRFSPSIEAVRKESLNKNPRQAECLAQNGVVSPSCMYGGNLLRVIVIGDSHADSIVSSVVSAAPDPQHGVMEWTYAGCPTIEGANRKGHTPFQCAAFLTWTFEQLKRIPPNIPLIIVNRTTAYAVGQNEGARPPAAAIAPLVYFSEPDASAPGILAEFARRLTDTACQLAKDRPVYLVRPIPEMGIDVPKAMARALAFGHTLDVSLSVAEYHRRHALVWAAQDDAYKRCGVMILDPLPYLCPDGRCHGSGSGRPVYYDDHHLSEYGNRLLVPMFAKVFDSL